MMDDQSSQITLHTSDSTIGPGTSFTDQYVVIDSQDEIIDDDDDNNDNDNYNNNGDNKNSISVYPTDNTNLENGNENHTINENNDNIDDDDDDDPLKVRQLALNFDCLIYNIQDQTQQFAEKVHDHVLAKKTKTDKDIGKINENLKSVRNLIDDCKNVDIEMEKLEQLQLITRDFKERLIVVERNLKKKGKKSG